MSMIWTKRLAVEVLELMPYTLSRTEVTWVLLQWVNNSIYQANGSNP